MNMNMKNEKTMLALVLVAALAMVSVAGVALASESDADVSNLTIISGDLDIKASTTDSYGVYVASGATSSTVTIAEDAAYSGTLCFGIYNSQTGIFSPLVTFTLTNVNNATFIYSAGEKTATIIGNTTGTIVISQGSVILGNDGNYFSGVISGNTSTITATNVDAASNEVGFTLEAGTIDILTGAPLQGDAKDNKGVAVDATIKMSGVANIGSKLTIGADVTFTVAEEATLNVPANSQTYSIAAGDDTTPVKLNVTIMLANLTGFAVGAIYDSDGQEVAKIADSDVSVNGTTIAFTLLKDMNMGEKYTVRLVLMNSTGNVYYYSGALSFTVTENANASTTMEAKATFTASSNASRITLATTEVSATMPILKTLDSTGTIVTYDSTDYYVAYAAQAGSTAPTNGIVDRANGKITFSSSIVDKDVLIILQNKTSGAYSYYYGGATSATAITLDASTPITALGVTTSAAADYKIYSGQIVASTAAGSAVVLVKDTMTTELSIATGANFVVDGNVFVGYTSDTICGKISNAGTNSTTYGEITVNGTIEYQTIKTATAPLTSDNYASGIINAVCYEVAPATTSTQVYTTFYYTTLTNAMAAASDMTIYGTVKVLSDTTLTGTPVGTATAQNTFTIGANSSLVIGQIADSDEDIEAITAIVTVPTTTLVTISSGTVNVINGQFKVEGLFTDSYGTASVLADVFMTDDTYGIYTDLATALNLAESGDTITTRNDANITLAADAEIKSGVTLDATSLTTGKYIIVDSDTTFTINGIIKVVGIQINPYIAATSTISAKAAGELVLNNYDATSIIDTIVNSGMVTVGASFDNTGSNDIAVPTNFVIKNTSSTNPAIVNIIGKIVYSGTITAEGSTSDAPASAAGAQINGIISGSMTFSGAYTASLTNVKFVCDITGFLTTSKDMWISVATVSGTIAVTGDGNVYIKESMTVGTPTTTVSNKGNTAKVDVILESASAYAFVYGTPSDSANIIINSGANAALVTTVYYLNTEVVYATAYAINENEIKITSIKDPAITGMDFYGWYSDVVLKNSVTTQKVGGFDKVYASLVIKTTSITLSMVQNGSYIINGINYGSSGNVEIPYAESYILSVLADNGYELSSDFQILVNGHAMPANYTPVEGDVISFSGTINEKSAPAEGMDLVTILLIIITIVIIIMAIIIALKLMRS